METKTAQALTVEDVTISIGSSKSIYVDSGVEMPYEHRLTRIHKTSWVVELAQGRKYLVSYGAVGTRQAVLNAIAYWTARFQTEREFSREAIAARMTDADYQSL